MDYGSSKVLSVYGSTEKKSIVAKKFQAKNDLGTKSFKLKVTWELKSFLFANNIGKVKNWYAKTWENRWLFTRARLLVNNIVSVDFCMGQR